MEIHTKDDKLVQVPAHIVECFNTTASVTLQLVYDDVQFIIQFAEDLIKRGVSDKAEIFATMHEEDQCYCREKLGALKVSQVMNIANACDTLGFLALQRACCWMIAMTIKGKSTKEMRALLDIENDFSPDEENKIIEECEWWK